MINFTSLYYKLPIHVIMTCLEKTVTNKATGTVSYEPLLFGQSASEVPGYATIVARLMHRSVVKRTQLKVIEGVDENTVSVAFFQPGGNFLAKDQTGTLGPWMADPSIPKMLDLIYGSNNT
jgi:hypothetical protein